MEGSQGYGCWFFPMMPPYSRGSGIFINTGRTLALANRRDAELLFNETSERQKPMPADRYWAAKAAAQGYDTVQILSGNYGGVVELLVTHESCRNQVFPIGACPPASIQLRTGFDAKLLCACSEYNQDGEPTSYGREMVGGPINCDRTPPGRQPW